MNKYCFFYLLIFLNFLSGHAQFVTTWETLEKITIPTIDGLTYNYSVDWGDGTMDSNLTSSIDHTYAATGIYTVTITGDFPGISFGYDPLDPSENYLKIRSIEQWGDQVWQSMENAFLGCELVVNATDIPDLSMVTSMAGMFRDVLSISIIPNMENWDVSTITNMEFMFFNARKFNQNISKWNVNRVTNMKAMFGVARSFNQDIGDWNVSNVTDMSEMFRFAVAFNQDISRWNVSSVTNMESMFSYAFSFNQDIGRWDVANVTNMVQMFFNDTSNTTSFNQNLGTWDVSNVVSMQDMFSGSKLSTDNYDALLEGWSARTLQNGVSFSAGNSVYCNGETAKAKIVDNFNWTITDGGKDCSTLSIPVLSEKYEFRTYPNPIVDRLQLTAKVAIDQVQLYTIFGQKVKDIQPGKKDCTVDTGELAEGLYILKVKINNLESSYKLLKKNSF